MADRIGSVHINELYRTDYPYRELFRLLREHGYDRVTLIEVGKSFVAPNSVIVRRIILPATLPYIMAGIRLAVGRAVVAMVIAEFFTSISGLGAIIITSANNFDTATMFVPIVILMMMAIGLNYLIGAVERWVAPWQAEIAGRDE